MQERAVLLFILSFLVFLIVSCLRTETAALSANNQSHLEISQEENSSDADNYLPNEISSEQPSALVEWQSINGEWKPIGTPPECPELVFDSPVDLGKVTSVLYPGQYRGNEYKAHGGFRFDNKKTNELEVRAPFDGYAFRGARYYLNGEIQYTVEIINECGIIHRLGHLLELAPPFDVLAQKLPEPHELDSRLYSYDKHILVKKGDLIATKVGVTSNVFMDWGAYDLRQENKASQDQSYKEKLSNMKDSAYYSVCWFEYLPEDEEEIVRNLPAADSVSGKQSDYC